MTWTPRSWQGKPEQQKIDYPDAGELSKIVEQLSKFPPLVTGWEIEKLRTEIAKAQKGESFVLQGGDCAESFDECTPEQISNKLKILLQMSLVLVHGFEKPIVRIGRLAGQYAKPRSKPLEKGVTKDGQERTLTSYYGDLVNGAEFSEISRTADPARLLRAYQCAALTLNYVRSLSKGGFSDLRHPEYWDLSFFQKADLPPTRRRDYQRMVEDVSQSLRFMGTVAGGALDDLSKVEVFSSHEGLNLHYESSQTREVPLLRGFYNLTSHMQWIGERTRDLNGAHVEFFRGVRNPIGIKLGPTALPSEVIELCEHLNPTNEDGKIVLITRLGASNANRTLPAIVQAIEGRKFQVLWMCDPMHGNTESTSDGVKTRRFDAILEELEIQADVHQRCGTVFGGVHFELTGEDVTECIGGASGITANDLSHNYVSRCDPRLNYRQSLEMAFRLAQKLRQSISI